ncbi:MAG: TIGR04283 family arsenosugar biosynthesis glycosyltransferase [Alphaproteobacteria bacterium]
MLSVVIPTLNGGQALGALLAELCRARAAGMDLEVVVSDGGSTDGTASIARSAGARLVEGPAGRGRQLARGAAEALGAWLLFVHADTRLDPRWAAVVTSFAAEPANAERAAVFRFALDDSSWAARRLEAGVAWRCRALGLPYGDQGLLLARAFYERLGGFKPIPLMEDVDLVRRIGRRRIVVLDLPAVTSAARYREDGWVLRPLRNLLCLALYLAGVPPRHILRLYG